MHLYHIRDNYEGGFVTGTTYSSSGIAWRFNSKGLGSLRLKPSGIKLKEFQEELVGYKFVNETIDGEDYTQTYSNGVDTKTVTWTTAPDSMPVIN